MTWSRDDPPVPGVYSMDHTADIGIVVEASDLSELFLRAARATLWMALERTPRDTAVETRGDALGGTVSSSVRTRKIRLETEGPAALLRAWLREMLYWNELDGFAVTDVEFRELANGRLDATVTGVILAADPVREIKGVTWHGLRLERARKERDDQREGGWIAQVIFDV